MTRSIQTDSPLTSEEPHSPKHFVVSMGLLEHSTDAFLFVKGQTIIACNASAAKLLGDELTNCVGKQIGDFLEKQVDKQPLYIPGHTETNIEKSLQTLENTGWLETQWSCHNAKNEPLDLSVTGEQTEAQDWGTLLLKPLFVPQAFNNKQLQLHEDAERIAGVGAWDWDLQTGELYWSSGLYDIYGRDPSQGPPTSVENTQLIHPDDVEVIRENLQRAIQEGIVAHSEYRVTRQDNKELRLLRAEAEIITDEEGTVSRLFGIVRDITEQRRTAEQLQDALHQLNLGINTAQLGIWKLDFTTGNLEWNDVMFQIFNVSKEEFDHDINSWRQRVHPDDFEEATRGFSIVQSGEVFYNIGYRLLWPNGEVRHIMVSGRPINDHNGDLIAMMGINVDVTDIQREKEERERAQQELRKHRDELEERVTNRTRELSALYKIASSNNQYNEIQSILQVILNHAMDAMQCSSGVVHFLNKETQCFELMVEKNLPQNIKELVKSVPEELALLLYNTDVDPLPTVMDNTELVERSTIPLDSLGVQYYAGVPIRAGGQSLGSLCVMRHDPNQPKFTRDELTLLTSIAEQTGAVWESTRLRRRIEKAAVLEERQRLARNLHDSVTQLLYSMTLLAEAGQRILQKPDAPNPSQYIQRLGEIAQQALKEMRLLIYELRPLALQQKGLLEALQHRLESVEARSGVEYNLQAQDILVLNRLAEEELYRIALEALNNALKHSGATQVDIKLYQTQEFLVLSITDNGIGFQEETIETNGGMGLLSIKERTSRLQALYEYQSQPEQGTSLIVQVPLSQIISQPDLINFF